MGRPLDKQQAVFYGRFVNAAYKMFEDNPKNPCPAPEEIPEPYELVAWLHMSDFFFWWREKPKFYGFIARHREQKHNFVLAIRGTKGWVEWLDDFFALLKRFRQGPNGGRVERGFDEIYKTLKVVKRRGVAGVTPTAKTASQAAPEQEEMQGTFADQLDQLAKALEEPDVLKLAEEKRPRRSFVVTGHSLGSALATLFVMDNKDKDRFDISAIYTFASPRVGDAEFVKQFNQLRLTSWRIVNTRDLVPRLPLHIPLLFGYEHVATEFPFSSAGVVKWWNPVCWHSMYTYLHGLDRKIDVLTNCKA